MAKKKLELEESHATYHAWMARAGEGLRADDLSSILSNATRAFDQLPKVMSSGVLAGSYISSTQTSRLPDGTR